jgi:RNA polymerase sigma-70 factor (ECF subfamily)
MPIADDAHSFEADALPTTRVTLLSRLKEHPSDAASWDEFVKRYGPHIRRWCQQWKLQSADADDLTQNVLMRLLRRLPDFTYDPTRSFRGWLKTVAYRAIWDFKNRRQARAAEDGPIAEMILSLEAREDLAHRLQEAFDLELVEKAETRVRQRVAPHTWEAFRLMTLENMPVAEVAERVRLQVAMVYVAKSKVQKLLQEEISKLVDA